MKIRKGFVSNSSSTSFIIDAKKYTCADVALQAAYGYYIDNNDGENDVNEFSINTYNKIKENLKKLKDKNLPMYIVSSDGIQIAKDGNKIYVEVDRGYHYDFDSIKEGEEGEYSDHFPEKYYFPQYDNKKLGKKIYSFELKEYGYNYDEVGSHCKCGESYYWILIDSGEIMCPACCKKPDGKYVKYIDRERKFKKINKK